MADSKKVTPLMDRMKEVNNIDLIPSPVKALVGDVFMNSVVKSNQDNIVYGNDFFAKSDMNFIKQSIKKKIKDNPSMKEGGIIEYKDYPGGSTSVERTGDNIKKVTDIFFKPEERVKKTLGQYGFRLNKDGGYDIEDRFNFNDAKAKDQDKSIGEKLDTVQADIEQEGISKISYGAIRKVAQHLGSSEGTGATFKLNLENLDD